MPITRREFIKKSAATVTIGALMPRLWLGNAHAQSGSDRRIFVVVQCNGGNDGLNTVVPYTNARYHALRPTLAFDDTELKDSQGRSTIISNDFGLHPALGNIKQLYDAGNVAVVLGVGYPDPNQSHFTSMDIWHTGNVKDGRGNGWLGKYADVALGDSNGLTALSTTFSLPKSLTANRAVIPSIPQQRFSTYDIELDPLFASDRDNRVNLLLANQNRQFSQHDFLNAIARNGAGAIEKVAKVKNARESYSSPVVYPEGNLFAQGMKVLAQVATTASESVLLYTSFGDFDNHAQQANAHANSLGQFSEGIKLFYDDMAAHGLADNVVIMQWSEFGRRPFENGSRGTDHGAASMMFLIGNPIQGGIYGEQPSLAEEDISEEGNLKFTVDFRSVYATVLDRWLKVDSREILGEQFENIGFLG
jgi:uncharacterized protein (DUF1501 family)